MQLREMTADDVPGGFALSRGAGWNQRAQDWTLLLSRNPGRFVAAVAPDGRIVGTAGAACYGTALAWVCMVLVDPESRGHGLGTRLMEAVLARLDDMSLVGLDATPQGRPVYAKLGFAEAGTFLRMGTDVERLGAADGTATPVLAGDLDAILRLDREVFGADRGEVLRWAFAQAPAFRVRDGDGVSAYGFARRGQHSHHVGPVVATNVASARSVLTAALGRTEGRLIVDANAEHPDWLAELGALGFREQRPLIRMYRHGGRAPGRPQRQFAIFGPEFG